MRGKCGGEWRGKGGEVKEEILEVRRGGEVGARCGGEWRDKGGGGEEEILEVRGDTIE